MSTPSFPLDFNANDHFETSARSFAVSPEKGFVVKITQCTWKESQQDAENHYLEVVGEILSTFMRGEEGVIGRYNLINKNPQAVKIAEKEMANLCFVIGRPSIADPDDLLGGELRVFVVMSDPEKGYTKVTKVTSVEGKTATQCKKDLESGIKPKLFADIDMGGEELDELGLTDKVTAPWG